MNKGIDASKKLLGIVKRNHIFSLLLNILCGNEKYSMKLKPTFLLALNFLFMFSGFVYGDDYQDGNDVADKGDYKTAFSLWKPLAERGLAEAQFNLGLMYSKELQI